ncbi:MAG: alpha/beta-type small acid-soluble spore protein [Oscillospiraceae bacterium]|nr:alpha/beta-type small acid-soluble spore protein [Oscillospiraceae bacterium]
MPKNKDSLQALKMQAANELNVPLKQSGYNGDLTARQVGSVGGQMVRKMIENYENGTIR